MDLLSRQAFIFLPPQFSFRSPFLFFLFFLNAFQDAEVQFLTFPCYCLDSESSERLVGRRVRMTEDSHFSHGLVPGDLQPKIIQVLFINSNNLNVPCALPTQLSDILLTSEPSAYARGFFWFVLQHVHPERSGLLHDLTVHKPYGPPADCSLLWSETPYLFSSCHQHCMHRHYSRWWCRALCHPRLTGVEFAEAELLLLRTLHAE